MMANEVDEQLDLPLDWGREPWGGRSPRSLIHGYCVVDNLEVGCPSREALRIDTDPAQLCVSVASSYQEVL